MTTEEILDRILVPRPNGSEALERVAGFLADALARSGAAVELQEFTATPHGFELAWTAALLLVAGWVAAIAARRYALALLLILATAALLLLEFELLRSPVSGLLPAQLRNVVGSFPGEPGGPRLIFCPVASSEIIGKTVPQKTETVMPMNSRLLSRKAASRESRLSSWFSLRRWSHSRKSRPSEPAKVSPMKPKNNGPMADPPSQNSSGLLDEVAARGIEGGSFNEQRVV